MIEEEHDREITVEELLTQNVAALASAVQTLNDVQLVILHNLKDLEIPEWKSIEDIEKDVAAKVTECVKAIRRAYGPNETDKS